MRLTNQIIEVIGAADCRALATLGADGPNVVPLSMVHVFEDKIVVCDCFMDKSAKNLADDARAAIAFWKGFVGVQVKGRVEYLQSGGEFDRCASWLKEKHPDRTLKGILVLQPEAVYDLAPATAGVRML